MRVFLKPIQWNSSANCIQRSRILLMSASEASVASAASRIRRAEPADAAGILAIYAPIVRETAISFELEPPTLEQMQARIKATTAGLPWLVAESGQAVMGYAYAGRHRERAAYQ